MNCITLTSPVYSFRLAVSCTLMYICDMHFAECRVAIPVKRFHDRPEEDIEEWYELGKNDFASELGTVSALQ